MITYGISETQTLVSIPLDENGKPRLDTLAPNPRPEDWTPPALLPLVKIDKPADDGIHRYEPTLVWFEDRVERQWQAVPLTTEEIAANARKIWPSVTEFWDEFTDAEQYGIEVHTDPEIVVLRAKLKLWLSDVWSDDPRIVMGLAALVSAGIIDETRKAEILAKD